jgi:hypothetical protein
MQPRQEFAYVDQEPDQPRHMTSAWQIGLAGGFGELELVTKGDETDDGGGDDGRQKKKVHGNLPRQISGLQQYS